MMRKSKSLQAISPSILPTNNLPEQLTSFIGRQKEIVELERLLSTTRLLTITGVGGCGKTRLCLQVAARVLEDFEQGVWLIELATVRESNLLPQIIAQSLELREEPERNILETLINYLNGKEILLVLDNCEHLVLECALLVEKLLRACPNLRILATSREALGIGGEVAWLVPSLSVPDLNIPSNDLQTLSQYEAVHLFVERTRPIQPHFTLNNQNSSAITQLCRSLDGIPLAIELAAARTRILTIEQIVARLTGAGRPGFHLLKSGSRTALPRQQTLEAAIEWSYNLLSPNEQLLLQRLAVFSGGWMLEAAEAIYEDAGFETYEVLDTLSQLVNKSLVVAEKRGKYVRYHLLEVIRQYSREKLQQSGLEEQASNRHLEYFLNWVEEIEPRLKTAQRQYWYERLGTEYDNLRAALDFSLREPERVELGARLVYGLYYFLENRNYPSESLGWLGRILEQVTAPTLERAKALYCAGSFNWIQGNLGPGQVMLEECIEIFRKLPLNPSYLAFALLELGMVRKVQGDLSKAEVLLEESIELFKGAEDDWGTAFALFGLGDALIEKDNVFARSLYEESLTLFRKTGDRWGMAMPLTSLGRVSLLQSDFGLSQSLMEESLAIRQEFKQKWLISISLVSLGELARCQDKYVQAESYLQEGLKLAAEAKDKLTIAWVKLNFGYLALHQNNHAQAALHFKEGMLLYQEVENKPGIARCLVGLGCWAVSTDQPLLAARLFGSAEALFDLLGSSLEIVDRAEYQRNLSTAHFHLNLPSFEMAWAEGRLLTLQQVITLSDQVASSVKPTLTSPIFSPKSMYPSNLTEREMEVLRLVAKGLTNSQIAHELVLSPRTVSTHLTSIFSKLEVTSRSAATRFAFEHNLV
jgi:predicted ATPase/DNA-binding CsgD family transcriptional regulator